MTNTTQDTTIDTTIDALRAAHCRTTQGCWGMGARINETVALTRRGEINVAKFRRVDDARFCDLVHAALPRILDEIEDLQDKVLGLTQKLTDYEQANQSSQTKQENETPMIINLTQHPASAEQLQAGVVDLPEDRRRALLKALTFDDIPSSQQIVEAAERIVAIALDSVGSDSGIQEAPKFAMIAGAPWLMSALENELWAHSMTPVYAFSARESEETVQPDGSTKKVNVFRHKGFVYL